MTTRIPHLRIVVAFCAVGVAGYAVFSYWAVFIARDATMIGDVGGTWKSFAVLAFGFWLGSSSGGKAQPDPENSIKAEVVNPPSNPVHTTENPPAFADADLGRTRPDGETQ